MKPFLFFVFFFTLTHFCRAQTGYPRFAVDSTGQSVVVMTVEQARALDNSTDLLVMFEKLNGQIGSYDSVCLKVVNEQEVVIASQTVQINILKSNLQTKEDKLINLLKQISEKDRDIIRLTEVVNLRDKEIILHKSEIRRSRTNYAIGGGIGGLLIAFLTVILAK